MEIYKHKQMASPRALRPLDGAVVEWLAFGRAKREVRVREA
jgi:hypothetical protein